MVIMLWMIITLTNIIGKKYLSKEQLEMFNQDAIEFEINDPF